MVDLVRNLRVDLRSAHDFVAYPETEEDISALLAECSRRQIAVVPFGGGSSVVGGVEAVAPGSGHAGCVAVDLAKMDRLLEVDEVSQCARVQAGKYGPALEAELRQRGLTFRHFPQSFEYSTVGGWLATRGGGHYATGPTHVDELVQSMRVVSPAGTTSTRNVPASGAGPAEHRLYLGSEGALGVITEAWLRVRRRPRTRASATVAFVGTDAHDAFLRGASAVRAIVQTGAQPANLRLVMGHEIARTGTSGLDESQRQMLASASVLLIGLEDPQSGPAAEAVVNAQLDMLLGIATATEQGGNVVARRVAGSAKASADLSPGGERDGIAGSWGQSFMRGGYMFSASVLFPSMLINTIETACTWTAFPKLHAAVLDIARDTIRKTCGVEGEVTCRFTHVYPDGPAPYYTFLVRGLPTQDPPPGQDDTRITRWLGIKRAVMDVIIAHGGTATHHHAVGRLHQDHYEAERGALFGAALAGVKAAHDPAGIMNPGIIVRMPRARL